jgi:hypothetical protein
MIFKQPFQAIFCAYPGGGKSVTLGSSVGDPRLGTILMLDTDNKIHSIASKVTQEVTLEDLNNPDFKLDPKGINLIRRLEVATETQVQKKKGRNEIKELINLLYTGGGCTDQVDTFYFDTITTYDQKLFLAYEAEKAASTNEKVRDNGFLTYSNMTKEIYTMLNDIASIDINFIGTAHIAENVPEEGEIYTIPKFSGKKLSIAAAGIFPLVAFITTLQSDKDKDKETRKDIFNLREFVFGDAWGKGLKGLHNQYEGSTLGISEIYEKSQPVLSLIMDGCGILPLSTTPVTTKTTKEKSK